MQIFTLIVLAVISLVDVTGEESLGKYKWVNNLELSYIRTSGNTNNETLAGKLALTANRSQNSFFFKADVILQKNDGLETGNETNLNGRYERKFGERVFVLLESKYEQDKFSGFNSRFSGGPGLGYSLFNSEKANLKAFASVQYHIDQPILADLESDEYTAAKFTMNGIFDVKNNLQLKNDLDFTQSTKDLSKYFVNNETAVKVKINSLISIGVRYKIKYESIPARENLQKLNTTFLSSLVFHW